MNKTAIGILSFVGGAVIGVVTGIAISRKTFQKQCDEYCNEVRKYYSDATQALGEEYMQKVYGSPEDREPQAKDINPDTPCTFTPPAHVDYHLIYSKHLRDKPEDLGLGRLSPSDREDLQYNDPPDPEEDMHPDDTDEVDLPEGIDPASIPDKDPDPYMISYAEYSIDDGLYSQEALTYWLGDGVLTDEEDNVLNIDLVGEANLQELRKPDVDEIYVRNIECGMEWEIMKMNRSFSDYLAGFDGPEDE